MHTIYDVVDASVNQSCHNKSKTLRVKLTVTPEPRSHRRETGAGRWHQHYNLDYRCNNTLNYIITIIVIRIIFCNRSNKCGQYFTCNHTNTYSTCLMIYT